MTRRLWLDVATADYASETLNFPGLRMLLRVDCESRPRGGEPTVETRYFASSLDPSRVTAGRLRELVRGHWQVENRLHYVRDVTMGEDANRTRTGSGPQVLAAMRNLAISTLRADAATNIAAALRRNAARVGELIARLCRLKY